MDMVWGPKRDSSQRTLLVPGLLEAKPRAWYSLIGEHRVELITAAHILQSEGHLFPWMEEPGFVPALNALHHSCIEPSRATLSPLSALILLSWVLWKLFFPLFFSIRFSGPHWHLPVAG